MALKRRTLSLESRTTDKKIAGMTAIDPQLDLGDGVSVVNLTAKRTAAAAAIDAYNAKLAEADALANAATAAEREYNITLGGRILTKVSAKYGKNSDQYEQVGGTRESEKKKPHPKAPPAKPA
ncbi:hypothetical protein [Armatimonas sp.]|uniref:hypothetical protein n=1 Tax=Armatimonas sp. TaxID=1872638 RepID=UPI00286D168C|nr:hypothetical protein [Armatimonas sp.]